MQVVSGALRAIPSEYLDPCRKSLSTIKFYYNRRVPICDSKWGN